VPNSEALLFSTAAAYSESEGQRHPLQPAPLATASRNENSVTESLLAASKTLSSLPVNQRADRATKLAHGWVRDTSWCADPYNKYFCTSTKMTWRGTDDNKDTRLCDALTGVNITTMVVQGDSLMRHLYYAVLLLLGGSRDLSHAPWMGKWCVDERIEGAEGPFDEKKRKCRFEYVMCLLVMQLCKNYMYVCMHVCVSVCNEERARALPVLRKRLLLECSRVKNASLHAATRHARTCMCLYV